MRGKKLLSMTLLLAALGGLQLKAGAETLADRVPADALLYAQWAGTDTLSAAYDNSHFKGLVDALNLPQLITQAMQNEQASQTDPDKLAREKVFHELFPVLLKATTGVYVGPFDLTVREQPLVKVGIFSKIGKADADKYSAELTDLIAKDAVAHPDRKHPPVAAKTVGDYLVIEVGDVSDLEKKLAGDLPTDGLSSTDGYKSAMNQIHAGASPAATVYINGEAVLKNADDGVAANASTRFVQMWPLIEDALGLTAVSQIAWAGNFDGKDWHAEAFVGLRQRRVGFAAFMDNAPLTDDTFKMIPKAATWVGTMPFDGNRLIDDLRNAAKAAGERPGQQFDFVLRQFFAFTGVDLEKDLFASLGTEYVYFGMPDQNGKTFNGFTIENKLKDPVKAESSLGTLESVVSAMVTQRGETDVEFSTQPLAAPFDKVTAHVITTKLISPAWAVSDGVLYISANLATLQNAVAAAKDSSILDNPVFIAARAKIAQKDVSSFQFNDMNATASETYELAKKHLALMSEGGKLKTPYTLPPLETLTPNLSTNLTLFWSDQDGFHISSIGPFPFSSAIDPQSMILRSMALDAREQQKKRAAERAGNTPLQ